MALAAIWRGVIKGMARRDQRWRNLSCSQVAANRQRSRGFQISHQFSPLGAKIQFCLLGHVLESQKSIFNFLIFNSSKIKKRMDPFTSTHCGSLHFEKTTNIEKNLKKVLFIM